MGTAADRARQLTASLPRIHPFVRIFPVRAERRRAAPESKQAQPFDSRPAAQGERASKKLYTLIRGDGLPCASSRLPSRSLAKIQ